jgi:hypothetical protein
MEARLEAAWQKLSDICTSLPQAKHVVAAGNIRAFTVGKGAGNTKLFAYLVTTQDERGIHVRSVDLRVLSDPRFVMSRLFASGRGTNWVRLKWTGLEPNWAEIQRLVVASHGLVLNLKKKGNRRARGTVYPILQRALDAADESERPTPPYHAGGPMPKLSGPAALRIALWSAEQVAPLAPADQREEVARVLSFVRYVASERNERVTRGPRGLRWPPTEQLRDAAATQRGDSRALGAARRAAGGAASLCAGKPDRVWENAALAAERVVQALRERKDHAAVRAYLTALDDRLLVEELGALEGDVRVARVLWRGANAQGLPALWLVRLVDGSYRLRRKVGSRFTWLTGSRDDVMASVPDDAFERAVAIAMARETATIPPQS